MSAMRHSFAQFGCAIFADNARTYAYHRWACANDMYPAECQPDFFDSSCVLDDPLVPYTDPATDPAPWYDANDPASTEFLGAIILRVEGANDSTIKREPVDALDSGTILNKARLSGRSFTLELLLLSTSCRGADFGIEWMRRVFETDLCICADGNDCQACFGKEFTLRRSCDSSVDDACDTGIRTWMSVGVVDGIKIQPDDVLDKCCCVAQRVTLVLQSESPYSYGCEDAACNNIADDDGYKRSFDWTGFCLEQCCNETREGCDRCLYDPLCDCFVESDPVPQSIQSELACYCEPLEKIIQSCCIEDVGSAGFDTALKIEIFSGYDVGVDEAALTFMYLGLRNVTLSIFDNPNNLDCIVDDETYEDWCNTRQQPRYEIKIPYIPANATLTIDGRTKRVFLDCDGRCRPFPYQIENASGSLFPLITNCNSVMTVIEWDTFNTQTRTGPDKMRSASTITTYRRWLS